MALIDRLLPLSTFVCFMGGNSGQMLIDLLRCHQDFAAYDRSPMDAVGRIPRTPFTPFTDSQYLQRIDHAGLLDQQIGRFDWLRDTCTRTWLRQQTEDWFSRVWPQRGVGDLEQLLAAGHKFAFPTHLTPQFLRWVMPESHKIFIVDRNAYFASRADMIKNPAKQPQQLRARMQHLAQRVAVHRWWNTCEDFEQPLAITVDRSQLFSHDRAEHTRAMSALFASHGIVADAAVLDQTWIKTSEYIAAQVRLGMLNDGDFDDKSSRNPNS